MSSRKPFRAVPLRPRPPGRAGKVVPFRKPRRAKAKAKAWRVGPIMVMAPLAAFTAVFLWDGTPLAGSLPFTGAPVPVGADPERARFAVCSGPARVNCVVDGDTFWYRGEKFRIAGLNAPEVSRPECAREAALGARATRRLTELLNAGAFSLEAGREETDRYGRTLRTVTRDGESLGAALAAEGLAREGGRYRGGWC